MTLSGFLTPDKEKTYKRASLMVKSILKTVNFEEEPFTYIDAGCSAADTDEFVQLMLYAFQDSKKSYKMIGFDPLQSECNRLAANPIFDGYDTTFISSYLSPNIVDREKFININEKTSLYYTQYFNERTAAVLADEILKELKCHMSDTQKYTVLDSESTLSQDSISLDDYFESNNITDIDFLKVDVDETHLGVLYGTKSSLNSRKLLGINHECFLASMPGSDLCNSVKNVDSLLSELGFGLFNMVNPFRYSRRDLGSRFTYEGPGWSPGPTMLGQTRQADFFFVRDLYPSVEFNLPQITTSPLKKLKLACLYSLKGQDDCAVEILTLFKEEINNYLHSYYNRLNYKNVYKLDYVTIILNDYIRCLTHIIGTKTDVTYKQWTEDYKRYIKHQISLTPGGKK